MITIRVDVVNANTHAKITIGVCKQMSVITKQTI